MTDSNEPETKKEPKIIKNTSQAYGYKYSSLADIAEAGVAIPQMRLKVIDGEDYIEYLDDKGDWQLGAKVVVPEMKGSNAAQAYGSAVTYARRYTVQLAKSLACDDDRGIERQPSEKDKTNNNSGQKPNKPATKPNRINFDLVRNVRAKLPTISTESELNKYWVSLKLPQREASLLKGDFAKRKKEIVGDESEPEVPVE